MRYDRIYEILAKRAIGQGTIDIETFIAQAVEAGMSEEAIKEQIEKDLSEGGPIFGKFFRSIEAASNSAVMAAARQAQLAGELSADEEIARFLDMDYETITNRIDEGDPEILEAMYDAAGDRPFTSVAELINTCHVCLPLHGKTMLLSTWEELGLVPEMRHEGWNSDCHCILVEETMLDAQDKLQLIDPLVRNKEAGSRRTVRGVTQRDVDRARAAVAKTMESEEGRATLRRLGQTNDSGE